MAVFVPFVLPGERVEAEIRREKSGFARASVSQLIDASPDRIEARCPYFRQCVIRGKDCTMMDVL